MKAPTKTQVYYKADEPRELTAPPRVWQRARIVIPCFDADSAEELSKKLAVIVAHDIEWIMGVTDDEATEKFGEVVLQRKFVPVDAMTVAEEEVAQP